MSFTLVWLQGSTFVLGGTDHCAPFRLTFRIYHIFRLETETRLNSMFEDERSKLVASTWSFRIQISCTHIKYYWGTSTSRIVTNVKKLTVTLVHERSQKHKLDHTINSTLMCFLLSMHMSLSAFQCDLFCMPVQNLFDWLVHTVESCRVSSLMGQYFNFQLPYFFRLQCKISLPSLPP